MSVAHIQDQGIEIDPATVEDFPTIQDLAKRIWWACFPGMISAEQIEYMLAERYTTEAMNRAVVVEGLTYVLLRLQGEPSAFAAHSPTDNPQDWKLQQLYVHPERQRRGLGGHLLDYVERCARSQRRRRLVLTVNRHNLHARAAYEQRGFRICGEVLFDIGSGFFMDDYFMAKALD